MALQSSVIVQGDGDLVGGIFEGYRDRLRNKSPAGHILMSKSPLPTGNR